MFYELGLAHAIAKPAILVTESIADVPFDLRALRVIEYDKNAPAWGEILGVKIGNAIKEVLAAPLQSVLPSFLEVEKTQRPPITEHQRELIEIRQELELLKRQSRRDAEIDTHISPTIARERIRGYLARGYPPRVVARRVAEMGAPIDWVENEIERLAGSLSLPTTQPSKSRAAEEPKSEAQREAESDGLGPSAA